MHTPPDKRGLPAKNLVDGRVLRPIREAGRNGQAAGVLSVSVRYSIEAVLEKSGYKDVFDSNLIVSNQILPAKRDMKSWESEGFGP